MNAAEERLRGALPKIQSSANKDELGIAFNLSQLKNKRPNGEHITIAVNILRDSLQSSMGDIYVFHNGDIILVYRGKNQKLISDAVFQLRYLFADDPLAYDKPGVENRKFCSLFDLGKMRTDFIEYCTMKLGNDNDMPDIDSSTQQRNDEPALLSLLIDGIEKAIDEINFDELTTLSPICLIKNEGISIKPVMYDINFDPILLQKLATDKLDILSRPSLYSFFSEFTDIRLLIKLLSIVKKPDDFQSMSLNLNVTTLSSEEFGIFDSAVPDYMKPQIMICMKIGDAYNNLSSFLKANDDIKDKGYKTCLWGLENLTFLQIHREAFGVDMLKLRWNSQLAQHQCSELLKQIGQQVHASGSGRVILTDCDNRQAFEIGRMMDICLFSGKYIDSINN
jgi:hypothetical protein